MLGSETSSKSDVEWSSLMQDYAAGILAPGIEKEVVLVSQWPKL